MKTRALMKYLVEVLWVIGWILILLIIGWITAAATAATTLFVIAILFSLGVTLWAILQVPC